MIIVGCSNSFSLANKIASNLKVKYSKLTVKKFPDGELYIKYECAIKAQDVILVQTLYPSNEAILEILLAAYTAKNLGAKTIQLVAPYMAYMRQDKRFNEGEAVSSLIIGKLFSDVFDKIITIDPHLHRHKNLNEVFKTKTKLLTANELIENYIQKNFKNAYIIGPDGESNQWAEVIAKKLGLNSIVFTKTRYSSDKVKEELQNGEQVKGKEVVIIDDIISSGHTILEAVKNLKKYKPKSISVIAIHGIFAEKEVYDQTMKQIKNMITTNTIDTKHSKIDVSELIAESLK